MTFEIALPLNFSRCPPLNLVQLSTRIQTDERKELIEPRQQPTFIMRQLLCKKDDVDCFPKEWIANNDANATAQAIFFYRPVSII